MAAFRSTAEHLLDWLGERRDYSFEVWWSWFLLWVILELLGYKKRVPWTTLSEYVWSIEGVSKPKQMVFMYGLATLMVHFVARWPRAD